MVCIIPYLAFCYLITVSQGFPTLQVMKQGYQDSTANYGDKMDTIYINSLILDPYEDFGGETVEVEVFTEKNNFELVVDLVDDGSKVNFGRSLGKSGRKSENYAMPDSHHSHHHHLHHHHIKPNTIKHYSNEHMETKVVEEPVVIKKTTVIEETIGGDVYEETSDETSVTRDAYDSRGSSQHKKVKTVEEDISIGGLSEERRVLSSKHSHNKDYEMGSSSSGSRHILDEHSKTRHVEKDYEDEARSVHSNSHMHGNNQHHTGHTKHIHVEESIETIPINEVEESIITSSEIHKETKVKKVNDHHKHVDNSKKYSSTEEVIEESISSHSHPTILNEGHESHVKKIHVEETIETIPINEVEETYRSSEVRETSVKNDHHKHNSKTYSSAEEVVEERVNSHTHPVIVNEGHESHKKKIHVEETIETIPINKVEETYRSSEVRETSVKKDHHNSKTYSSAEEELEERVNSHTHPVIANEGHESHKKKIHVEETIETIPINEVDKTYISSSEMRETSLKKDHHKHVGNSKAYSSAEEVVEDSVSITKNYFDEEEIISNRKVETDYDRNLYNQDQFVYTADDQTIYQQEETSKSNSGYDKVITTDYYTGDSVLDNEYGIPCTSIYESDFESESSLNTGQSIGERRVTEADDTYYLNKDSTISRQSGEAVIIKKTIIEETDSTYEEESSAERKFKEERRRNIESDFEEEEERERRRKIESDFEEEEKIERRRKIESDFEEEEKEIKRKIHSGFEEEEEEDEEESSFKSVHKTKGHSSSKHKHDTVDIEESVEKKTHADGVIIKKTTIIEEEIAPAEISIETVSEKDNERSRSSDSDFTIEKHKSVHKQTVIRSEEIDCESGECDVLLKKKLKTI